HRFDLRTFPTRDLADDRNPNGAFTVGDAFQFENRASRPRIDIAHGFAERTFFFHVICRNNTLENNFGGRRHFEIDGLAFDQFHRFAYEPARQSKFVHIRRNFLCRGIGYRRYRADDDCDLERNASFTTPLPMRRKILWRAGHEAAQSGTFDQAAVVTDVSLPRLRIFADPMPSGDVRAIIEARSGDRYGELI